MEKVVVEVTLKEVFTWTSWHMNHCVLYSQSAPFFLLNCSCDFKELYTFPHAFEYPFHCSKDTRIIKKCVLWLVIFFSWDYYSSEETTSVTATAKTVILWGSFGKHSLKFSTEAKCVSFVVISRVTTLYHFTFSAMILFRNKGDRLLSHDL